MRIALIGNTLFHHGAEYVMAVLARGLAAKGHEVDVVLSQLQNDMLKEQARGLPFELPDAVRVVVGSYRRGRQSVGALRKLMKARQYDVVMSHASPYSIPLVLAAWGLRRRPILIHVQHSSGTGVDENGQLLQPHPTFRGRVFNWLMGRFDAQFAVSNGTAEGIHRMSGYPREKIFNVYNPVVDEVFNRKVAQEPEHPWLSQREIPVIIAAGTFYPYKNHKLLIRAFADVVKQKDARLIIFGEGPMRGEYEALVKELGIGDKVSIPGFTDNMPAAMKRSACYVISSTIESFSVVCVEALAAGTPVVSTNCPYGPLEILKGGKYGILVENKNQHALAEGVLKVLNGDGIKPTPEMVAPYTVEATVERYERAIERVRESVRN